MDEWLDARIIMMMMWKIFFVLFLPVMYEEYVWLSKIIQNVIADIIEIELLLILLIQVLALNASLLTNCQTIQQQYSYSLFNKKWKQSPAFFSFLFYGQFFYDNFTKNCCSKGLFTRTQQQHHWLEKALEPYSMAK